MDQSSRDRRHAAQAREEQWERRLAIPVLVAALASVPAVFLTLLDQPYATAGTVINWIAGGVLIAETVVLFAVSGDKIDWIRRHKWLVALTVAVVIAVVFTVGPVQLLRLLRVVGALRIIRAGRIIKAGRILQERMGLTGRWSRVPAVLASVLVAAFVAVVLSDPTSQTRAIIEGLIGRTGGTTAAIIAGIVLAGATFVVMRRRLDDQDAENDADADDEADDAEQEDA
ncbi:hypothetical protein [Nesterenkonia halophila]|uniref:hypothetical protein n=1 Tax=Nesterenkonia halophila TaxID=302044 RepID=UPI001B863F78|nr:hypothetical protein [Nesterenkonia halophila]